MKLFPKRTPRCRVVVRGHSVKKRKELPDFLGHLQLPKVRRPKFAERLHFPEDMTALDTINVSDLMGKYTLLLTYAAQDMAELVREELRLKAMESRRREEVLRINPRINTMPKYKKEAFMETDASMRHIQDQRTIIAMRKEHTGMWMANFDRYITALSRDLTRRTNTEERARRFAPSY